ncbi:hypothetical protein LIER_38631 [Lithospermum erythrorhizon]|uniref:Non-specific lipid-transfer protein n=1 Tax=Lithospermum erythrorhizon TaxID=34254 RepID=A0AAV3Q2V3_LITER
MEMISKVACIVLLSMIVVAPHAEASMTCSQVSSAMYPCLSYLTTGGSVSSTCCSGVKGLNAAASTTTDRQTACKCLKSFASSISSIDSNNAAALPGLCGVSISYKISSSTDCSKVQ